MKKILFVDDEVRVLESIKRMMHSSKDKWSTCFATGGEEALALMQQRFFDVVVSDMRMPRMNGATLLQKVKDQYPNAVRIILSGYSEMEAALKAVPVAHQFLSKPCNKKLLVEIIERACNLKVLLEDNGIQAVVSHIDQMPALPKIYHALTQALANPDASVEEIAKIIEQDISISAKILQLVNSAFFGLPRNVGNIQAAVSYIGTNMLKNLVLSAEVFHAFDKVENYPGYSHQDIHFHSMACANVAKSFFDDKRKAEDAFIAAMLHDIGKLIMIHYLPNQMKLIQGLLQQEKKPAIIAEKEVMGITHAELGAYLLGIWGFPYNIVEAIAYHHHPTSIQSGFGVLPGVYVADCLVHEAAFQTSVASNQFCMPLDIKYMKQMGVENRIDEWRKKAAKMVTENNLVIV